MSGAIKLFIICLAVLLFVIYCVPELFPKEFKLIWEPYAEYGTPEVDKLRLAITAPYAAILQDSIGIQDSTLNFELNEGLNYKLCLFAVLYDSILSVCATVELNLEKPEPVRGIAALAIPR